MPVLSPNDETMAPIAAITRRRIVIGGAGALLARSAPARAQTPGATPTPGVFPRTIVDARGEAVAIPAQPQRIYTLRNNVDFDTVVALGVVPVGWGMYPDRPLQPYQLAAGGEANGIDINDGPDLEALIEREVDLIVGNAAAFDLGGEEMEALQTLGVPTVALSGTDIHEQLRVAGEALGLEAVAAEVAAEFDANLQAFRPTVAPASLALMVVFDTEQLWLLSSESGAGATIAWLGLPQRSVPDGDPFEGRTDIMTLSLERSIEVDAEWLLAIVYDRAVFDDLLRMPVFQAIPAVAAGRIRTLEGDAAWAMTNPDVLTLPITIAALTEAFSGG